jgi:hypothetical protein
VRQCEHHLAQIFFRMLAEVHSLKSPEIMTQVKLDHKLLVHLCQLNTWINDKLSTQPKEHRLTEDLNTSNTERYCFLVLFFKNTSCWSVDFVYSSQTPTSWSVRLVSSCSNQQQLVAHFQLWRHSRCYLQPKNVNKLKIAQDAMCSLVGTLIDMKTCMVVSVFLITCLMMEQVTDSTQMQKEKNLVLRRGEFSNNFKQPFKLKRL